MGNPLVVRGERAPIPGQVVAGGERATRRFVEFFTANIRNRNTRAAYMRAVSDFFQWCEESGLRELIALQPVHVAAYVGQLGKTHSAPSVKQHLAAVRMLFDWLVVGQVVASNPASVVRGPKHVVKRGKTPVLVPEEAHALFESIPTDTLVGLRDRALLAVLIYSFARISAALSMRVGITSPRASAGGSGSTKRAGNITRCRYTIRWRRIWTATSARRGSARTRKGRCFGRRSGERGGSPSGRWPAPMRSTWFSGGRERPGLRHKSAATPSGRPGSPFIFQTTGFSRRRR
jgi:site-specific recombinase XerC